MLDWIERLMDATDKRIQHWLVVAIAYFLAMSVKEILEKEDKP